MFKRMLRNNKKAFSLVELLCAIVLLAIVATPIIQVIYSSFNLNTRSKRLLAAADLTSDIMEYVGSTPFDDFTYTDDSVTPAVTHTYNGLKKVYWKENASVATTSLGVYNSTDHAYYVFPGGPKGEYTSYTVNGSSNRSIEFKNVNYDGYKFRVKVEIDNNQKTGDKYWTYDVHVEVKDNDTASKVYSDARTCIPNTYK